MSQESREMDNFGNLWQCLQARPIHCWPVDTLFSLPLSDLNSLGSFFLAFFFFYSVNQ